mmetsp:Transcript_3886/g.10011  ORF Transcript_3886/g.10011 Transcript_3886/m.10011 type:complete len:204 (-) Transcript_3886:1156-1767(-)
MMRPGATAPRYLRSRAPLAVPRSPALQSLAARPPVAARCCELTRCLASRWTARWAGSLRVLKESLTCGTSTTPRELCCSGSSSKPSCVAAWPASHRSQDWRARSCRSSKCCLQPPARVHCRRASSPSSARRTSSRRWRCSCRSSGSCLAVASLRRTLPTMWSCLQRCRKWPPRPPPPPSRRRCLAPAASACRRGSCTCAHAWT